MKYFGEETKQDFIDCVYESEVDIYFKGAAYTFWLDGNGYNIGLTGFEGRNLIDGEHERSILSAPTVEELIDKYVLYDGTRLSDAMEIDISEL